MFRSSYSNTICFPRPKCQSGHGVAEFMKVDWSQPFGEKYLEGAPEPGKPL